VLIGHDGSVDDYLAPMLLNDDGQCPTARHRQEI